jgi:hypothetical protein
MPYKIWSVNEILTAADMNDYVGNQTVLSFAGTAARATAIGTPVEGMVSYVGSGVVEVYAGTATGWTQISGGGGVTVGTAAPDSPSDGDLWWDSDDGELYLYYNDDTSSQWVAAAGPSVTVAATAPTGYEGQLWLDSTDGSMYVYYTDPGGANAQWIGAVSRSGGILQVVSTTKTDTFSMASATFADVTGLSVSITPQSTSSKILVSYDVQTGGPGYSTGQSMLRLLRDSTPIAIGDSAGSRILATTGATNGQDGSNDTNSAHYLDSPATVSTLTYKIQIRQSVGTGYVNRSSLDSDNIYYGRTVSTITVMEIAG